MFSIKFQKIANIYIKGNLPNLRVVKPFDTVNANLLTRKLTAYGFSTK